MYIIADRPKEIQPEKLPPRRERRVEQLELYRRFKKLKKRIKGCDLPVDFDNDSCTSVGNFASIESFKRGIGFLEQIKGSLTLKKGANSMFGAPEMIDYQVDALLAGYSRIEHTEQLRFDPGYLKVKGIKSFPSEKCFRDLYSQMEEGHLAELEGLNLWLIKQKSLWEGPCSVSLDYDDTVITLHGQQELGEVGYNPRYHGRPSLKVKVCFISGTDEVLSAQIYGGKTHSNGGFLEFHNACEAKLPHNYVLKRVRLDKGFFDEVNFQYFEESTSEYICKAPLKENLKRVALDISDWEEISKRHSVAERTLILPSWSKPRRFIFIREKMDQNGQLLLPGLYKYQAIVTNIEEETPLEIWQDYNRRARIEGTIEELKDGFACEQMSQHEIRRNLAFMGVKLIAYNLHNFFKKALLPDHAKGWKIKTLRMDFLRVPGNIVGNGRYRRIRLAGNRALMALVEAVKANLERFLWQWSYCLIYHRA